MKIAIFALLMVVVLTLVQTRTEIDAVDELRSKRDLINKLVLNRYFISPGI
jgi:hypothetical protein